MSEKAKAPVGVRAVPKAPGATDKFEIKKQIEKSHTSELVIALCGPIGSPLHKVSNTIKDVLERNFGYDYCKEIRLSRLIEEHAGKAPTISEYDRVKFLITQGNELRAKHENSILAELAVRDISLDREAKGPNEHGRFEPQRVCHIIDSIKNQEELEVLKLVYRDMFYFVGVFTPLPARIRDLANRGIRQSHIFDLIDQDSGEELDYGQTVRDTFPQADFFIRIDNDVDSQISARVERFLHLILGAKVLTPHPSETAMYLAASAAGNSGCLSKQVGAALTDANGSVISIGWNDVPKFSGGLYGADAKSDPNSEQDKRCWNLEGGRCFNDKEKKYISELMISGLVKSGIISKEEENSAIETILSSSKVKDLIEFSRAIHAEMNVIFNAVKTGGDRIKGGKLFCTTYPCHSCARHIITAGISEVYYIEPYRKSLATKLHGDAITEEESDTTKVRILPYDGVAPMRYLKLFRVPPDSRKEGGMMVRVDPETAAPRFDKTLEALPTLEALVVRGLRAKKLLPEEDAADA